MHLIIELLALVIFLVVMFFIIAGLYFIVVRLMVAENRADLWALMRASCRKNLRDNANT